MEAAQPSSSKVTKSQWGKVISKYQVYLQVFVLQKKKSPYHIYWLCFHFPLGEPIVMRKEMKEDCFLPSALSTQLILLGGQISAVPGEEKQKMSLINQKQNDQWPVSVAMRNRGCEQHSRAYYSSLNEGRRTEDDFHPRSLGHLGRLSLIALRNEACWLHPGGIFRKSLKNDQWVTSSQTNILPGPLMTGIHQQHN